MKDVIEERIKQLGTVKSFMEELAKILAQEEHSQILIEEETYELMNNADKSLSNSTEAILLFNEINTCFSHTMEQTADINKDNSCIKRDQMKTLINNIIEASNTQRVSSRNLERYVVKRRDIFENLKSSIESISELIDQAIDCAEMVMIMNSKE